MKAILFILSFLLLFNSVNLCSQETTSTIKGKVLSVKDKTPVEAELRLFTDSDSSYVKGTKSDSLGLFVFSDVKIGTYRIEITAIGYSTKNIHGIRIESAEPYVLDTIYLNKQDVTTEEINVEGEKSLIEFQGDKKVFNVQKSMLNKGGTALDVLKKVPLIDVDINDNVTLRGSTNVKILIDDRPNRYTNLKQLPADAIEKVEIITNPPAKYEAEGVTGIINIVTKKIESLGYNGNASLDIGSRDKYDGGLDLNLKKKKWTFFGAAYLGLYNYTSSFNGTIQYLEPISYLTQNGNETGRSKYFYTDLGAEYEISKGHILGLEGDLNGFNYTGSESGNYNSLDSKQSLTSFYTKSDNYDGKWKSYSFDMYYTGKLNDKGRELTADLSYSGPENTNSSNYLTRYYDAFGNMLSLNPVNQKSNTNNKSYNLNAQVDYTHPFSDKSKLEAGYKGTFRANDNDYVSDTLDYASGTYIIDQTLSNHFKLSDRINALYLIYGNGYRNFSFKAGLRAEHTYTKGELFAQDVNFTKNYIDFFPSLSLSQKIGAMNQLQFSYSRRITRPSIWRLNPFVYKSDARFVRYGNPDLNPEFTDSYELSYLLYTKAITVTPMLFFRQGHDIISGYSYLADSNVSVTTYRNASGSKSYGLDLVLNSQAVSWINLTGTLSFYNTKFDPDVNSDYSAEEGFTWKGNIRASLKFEKILEIELSFNSTGKKVNAQGTTQPMQQFNVSISKSFLKDKARVAISAHDLFKSMQWGQDVNAVGYNSTYRSDYDTRVVYLNLSYEFGNTDEYYQKNKKVKRNQNENQDQQDSNGTGK